MPQKNQAGQTLYRTLLLHIHGEEKNYLDSDIKKQGRSNHFSEGTGCK